MGLPRRLQRKSGGDGTRRPAGAPDLQLVELVHAADGTESGPSHRSHQIARNFLFLAAQVVESGRQRTLKLAVKAEWWQVLKGCYERLRTWLAATAPQLESQGNFLRLLSRQTTDDPLEWLAQPAPTPTG